jgi:hypothetical protein
MSDINNLEMIYEYRILLKCGEISKLSKTLEFAGAIIGRLDGENPNYKGIVDLRIENKAYYNEGDFETTTEPPTEKTQEPLTDENGEAIETETEPQEQNTEQEN